MSQPQPSLKKKPRVAAAAAEAKRSLGVWLKVLTPAFLVTALGFALAFQFVEPAPPSRIVIATGAAGGGYDRWGKRYAELLAEDGVEIELRQTAGSVENLALLAAGEVDVGFVQSGTAEGRPTDGLAALGSLYYEPLWIFVRGDPPRRLSELAGKKLEIGAEGSGTRAIALRLLEQNGVEATDASIGDLDAPAAADALRRGECDAAFFVSSPHAAPVKTLLHDPSLTLTSFERAEGYARVFPFLATVTVSAGMIDFAKDLPPEEVRLIAPAAVLVARSDLHPALVDLLIGSAETSHSPAGMFSQPDEFPKTRFTDVPMSKEARSRLERGPSLLQRVLPFWAANFVDRMKVMLLPLITLLLPLFRIAPALYSWRVRAKIYRWYEDLLEVDSRIAGAPDDAGRAQLDREIDRVEHEVSQVEVPLSYMGGLYDLRMHIGHVRARLKRAGPTEPSSPPAPAAS